MIENKKESYLKQLKDIERRDKFRQARKEYKKVKYPPIGLSPKELSPKGLIRGDTKYFKGRKFLKKEKNPVKIAALAYRLMEEGIDRKYFQYSLLGAQLYEKIGKGNKAISRLLKTVERSIETGTTREEYYQRVEDFIKRNTGGGGGLEKKFGIFVAFIIGGVALGLGSLTITGNAISNLTGTTPGLLGIILFIAGLVGMFFYFKGK
jgi:hypothetical protein